jgi:hypothetical protein
MKQSDDSQDRPALPLPPPMQPLLLPTSLVVVSAFVAALLPICSLQTIQSSDVRVSTEQLQSSGT